MIREPPRRRSRQHQGFTRLAETERPGRTVVTVSEQVTDDNGHSALAVELARLRAENARLLRLLNLTRQEAAPPGPWQSGLFEAPPGLVHADSPPEAKVALFGALFAARTDVYAIRWENTRTGKAGWLPAVRGGWRKGVPHADRDYLPLTGAVLASHLSGDVHIGFYPLLDGDRCWWLAADFRWPRGDAGRAGVPQSGEVNAGPGSAGGLPVRGRRACLGVLHRPGPGRGSAPPGHWPAARGDGAARAYGPG